MNDAPTTTEKQPETPVEARAGSATGEKLTVDVVRGTIALGKHRSFIAKPIARAVLKLIVGEPVRFPDGPGMWLWSEHSEPVEVWILGWWDDTPEEDKDWSLDDLRFEIDGRRYVPAELGGTWKRAQAQNGER